MDLKVLVARNLRSYRKAKGMTQEQFARRTGLNEKYLSSLETKEEGQNLTLDTIAVLAEGLEIAPSDLLQVPGALGRRSLPKKYLPGMEEAIRILQLHVQTEESQSE